MISNEWKEVNLSEVCEIIGGGTPKTSISNYWNGDIPWLSVVDFNSDNRHVFTTEKTITESGLNNSSTKILNKGDIIISARGTVGALAQLAMPMAFNQSCYGIRANNKSINDFLYYSFKNILKDIKANTHGSVFDTITRNTFEILNILLPSLPEQKAIAATLSCLDDMIEVNNRTNQVLEEIAQAIFKRWFVDFEFPNEDGEPYKSSGGEMVDSELGKIPKGWRTGYVNEICKVIYGAPFKSSLFNKVKNGWPLIRIRDLKTFNPQFYTNEQNPRTEFVQPGDILVGMDAEFRPCIWKGDKGVLNQRVCKFEPRLNEVCRFFVYSIIKPHLEFIEGFKVGTTVSHIGKGDIDKIQLIIPSNEALIMFKNTVEPLYLDIINNCKQNRILEPIRDSLLPKLMSGEIRVPIEEVV